jgi:DNA-binding SARP family transcriptional activator
MIDPPVARPGRDDRVRGRYRSATRRLRGTVFALQLDFRILGSLEVTSPAGQVRLGGPRQRSVLALLLLDPNRIVSIDRLADALYGEAPPVSAVTQVHRQISELRGVLEPERAAGSGPSVIETRPPGYRIAVRPGALDLQRFERLAERAGSAFATGDSEVAVRLYRDALALWRGEPLADLAFEPFARPIIERLLGLRLGVVEACLEAELELGRGGELVAELTQLVREHPLNERLRGQLMIALYRAGRQTEALEAFRAGRVALVEAFGLEPTPALRELEGRILRQDPALDGSDPPLQAPAPERRRVLLAAREDGDLHGLVALGRCLAELGRRELLITQAVAREGLLAAAVTATRGWRDALADDGVASRAAAFVSQDFGPDMARLALTHEADLLLVAAPAGIEEDGMLPEALAGLLEAAPCDVALLAGSAPRSFERGIVVLFGGSDHDWAAAELGAWLAAAAGVRLQLVGVRGQLGADGAGASRLLASASLAIQQLVGIDVDPSLADPGPEGVTAAARSTGIVIVGLSNRWRRDGLGASRRTLLASLSPTLLVHRGARPGGLAPRESRSRFTWTMASGP